MNWFERYGIVGAYFLLLTLVWLYPVITISEKVNALIIGAIVVAVIPVGYAISVCSQMLYYKHLSGHRIHSQFIKKELDKNLIKKCGLKKQKEYDEWQAEAKLTEKIRLTEGSELDRIKYLTSLITKRFDVIAINKSIILSTGLAFLIAIICRPVFFNKSLFYCFISGRSGVLALLSIAIIITLMLSNNALYKQIHHWNKAVIEYVVRKEKKNVNENET